MERKPEIKTAWIKDLTKEDRHVPFSIGILQEEKPEFPDQMRRFYFSACCPYCGKRCPGPEGKNTYYTCGESIFNGGIEAVWCWSGKGSACQKQFLVKLSKPEDDDE